MGRADRAQQTRARRVVSRRGWRRCPTMNWSCAPIATTRCSASTSPSGKVVEEIAVGVAPFQVAWPGATACSSRIGAAKCRGRATRGRKAPGRMCASIRAASPTTAPCRLLGRAGEKMASHPHHRSRAASIGPGPERDRRIVFVANACSDSVSVISVATNQVIETIACRSEARLPFGSAPMRSP